MKKILLFGTFFIAVGLIIFSGCSKEEYSEPDQTTPTDLSIYKDAPVFCGEPLVTTISDIEESINAGTVTVGNDATHLYVTFEAGDNWKLNTTYLYVGPAEDVPGTANPGGVGDFEQWNFPIADWHSEGTLSQTYSFELADLNECFIVVAYTNPENIITGDIFLAWGKTEYKASGFYIDYCVQECPPPPALGNPKLAFAYNEDYSQCFKDLKRSNAKLNPSGNGKWSNFMLWGWRNGKFGPGQYTFDLYAGAQGCDPENGILVGTVTLDYDGSTAEVTYNVDPAYTLVSTYLYVGKKRLHKKWGKFNVIPWFYPKKHSNVYDVTDSFTKNNLNGEVRMVAGAIVKDAL